MIVHQRQAEECARRDRFDSVQKRARRRARWAQGDGRRAHLSRHARRDRRAVPELAHLVRAPGHNGAVIQERKTVLEAGRDGSYPRRRRGGRRRPDRGRNTNGAQCHERAATREQPPKAACFSGPFRCEQTSRKGAARRSQTHSVRFRRELPPSIEWFTLSARGATRRHVARASSNKHQSGVRDSGSTRTARMVPDEDELPTASRRLSGTSAAAASTPWMTSAAVSRSERFLLRA